MKVVAISDLHQRFPQDIPQCDLLIVAGDISSIGTLNEWSNFCAFLMRINKRYDRCLVVPGNHEKFVEKNTNKARAMLTEATLLIDEGYCYKGLQIWGSPWTPEYRPWAYSAPRGEKLKKKWSRIPEDLDILITHGPPYDILDNIDEQYVGCVDLRNRVCEELVNPPRYHIFGHIHEAHGKVTIGKTVFMNVAMVDKRYRLAHEFPTFEIDSLEEDN